MPLTIEHHAVMFALLAKHAIEISGEKGKEAILKTYSLRHRSFKTRRTGRFDC